MEGSSIEITEWYRRWVHANLPSEYFINVQEQKVICDPRNYSPFLSSNRDQLDRFINTRLENRISLFDDNDPVFRSCPVKSWAIYCIERLVFIIEKYLNRIEDRRLFATLVDLYMMMLDWPRKWTPEEFFRTPFSELVPCERNLDPTALFHLQHEFQSIAYVPRVSYSAKEDIDPLSMVFRKAWMQNHNDTDFLSKIRNAIISHHQPGVLLPYLIEWYVISELRAYSHSIDINNNWFERRELISIWMKRTEIKKLKLHISKSYKRSLMTNVSNMYPPHIAPHVHTFMKVAYSNTWKALYYFHDFFIYAFNSMPSLREYMCKDFKWDLHKEKLLQLAREVFGQDPSSSEPSSVQFPLTISFFSTAGDTGIKRNRVRRNFFRYIYAMSERSPNKKMPNYQNWRRLDSDEKKKSNEINDLIFSYSHQWLDWLRLNPFVFSSQLEHVAKYNKELARLHLLIWSMVLSCYNFTDHQISVFIKPITYFYTRRKAHRQALSNTLKLWANEKPALFRLLWMTARAWYTWSNVFVVKLPWDIAMAQIDALKRRHENTIFSGHIHEDADKFIFCSNCNDINSYVVAFRTRVSGSHKVYKAKNVGGLRKVVNDVFNIDNMYCGRKIGKKSEYCRTCHVNYFFLTGYALMYYGKWFSVCPGCGLIAESDPLHTTSGDDGPLCMLCNYSGDIKIFKKAEKKKPKQIVKEE